MSETTRRDFLKTTAATAAVAATGLSFSSELEPPTEAKTMIGVPFERHERVRFAIIGVGGRGQGLLNDVCAIDWVDVKAICDIVPQRLTEAQAIIKRSGRPEVATYGRSDTDFERLCARDDLDIIYIATPWDWHVPMALSALKHGHHACSEVLAAETVEDCWKLVDASEATRRHCIMLENCCYGYNEMMVLNMVRAGFFGELIHGEAAYLHDLRGLMISDSGEGLWRRAEHTQRNGNLYPTHGLGPVANYLGINRGDRFTHMVSMSSREAALTEYRDAHVPADSPKRKEVYINGDMNTSLIRTELGRTVMLQHNVVAPRPYSRLNQIQGTKACFADYPERIFVDGQPKDEWDKIDAFKAQYEHPLWTREGEIARRLGGHGGMDFIMSYRLMQCMRDGIAPDMDVYDAAAWSAPAGLSMKSVAHGSAPQKFPDFTRGHWKDRKPLVIG